MTRRYTADDPPAVGDTDLNRGRCIWTRDAIACWARRLSSGLGHWVQWSVVEYGPRGGVYPVRLSSYSLDARDLSNIALAVRALARRRLPGPAATGRPVEPEQEEGELEPDNPSLELTAAQLRGIVRHVRGALDGQSFLVEYDGDAGVDGHRITPVGGGRPFLIDGGGRTRSTSKRS